LEEIGLFEPFVNANILLITSHTTKRSFATNYFEKIETPILMEITGHSRESTFLSYMKHTIMKNIGKLMCTTNGSYLVTTHLIPN
jgi:hypothetical protein